jgi:CBS domain-containing protein
MLVVSTWSRPLVDPSEAAMPAVRDLMTSHPVSIDPQTTIATAIEMLTAAGVSELYVTDRDVRLLGVVTDYELLKARMSGIPAESGVTTQMSRGMMTVTPDANVESVARLFRDGRYSQLAVVADGRLVGVVHRREVLSLYLDRCLGTIDAEVPRTPQPEEVMRKPRYRRDTAAVIPPA